MKITEQLKSSIRGLIDGREFIINKYGVILYEHNEGIFHSDGKRFASPIIPRGEVEETLEELKNKYKYIYHGNEKVYDFTTFQKNNEPLQSNTG